MLSEEELHKLGQWSLHHCLAVFAMSDRRLGPEGILPGSNGTAGLIQTSEGRFLVTAFHVWNAYEKLRSEHSDAVVAAITGDAEAPLIVRADVVDGDDKDLDIVILRPRDPDELVSTSKRFWSFHSWPPARVREGEFVAIPGFPAEHRGPFKNGVASQGRGRKGDDRRGCQGRATATNHARREEEGDD